ncbi:MAG: molybdopterin dinucleotide binding domain-containing protein, partial [Dehalococcoidia bacterium]|nr:molybdopterin dinucleotide binding domain-containing protein [Dehalococcoidia bacterium]
GREARPALQKLKDHVAGYTPEWAEGITDIAAVTTRRIAAEYIEAARIGSTIQIDGVTLPLRPVAIKLGRGVTGQMLSYQCALSQHILAILVGGLEVPGGHGGGRTAAGAGINTGIGISPGPDGMTNLVSFPFTWPPVSYSGAETLLPYSKAYALAHPRHLAYRHLVEPPKNFPIPAPPEALIRYRCNPLTAVGEHQIIFEALRRIPFIVSFSYLPDEMTQLADIVLPEHLDLERYDLATYVRSATARRFLGVLLRQPAVEPVNDTMEISEILTELASRMGFLDEYNAAINEKLALNGENKVQAGQRYTWEEIMDRFCKSVSGGECDLEWFRSNGGYLKRVPVTYQYDVHLEMVDKKLRYPLPYMEHVKITGEELAANLKKVGVDWWPTKEYLPLPTFFPNVMEEMPEKYDFYVTTVRNAQFSWGSNIECPWLIEAADLMAGQQDIYMNTKAAKQKGIKDGDEICVESEVGKVKRKVKLTEGIRPDTLLIPGQFGQWAAPGSKETGRVSQVTLSPIRHSWTDHFMSNMQGQTVKAMVYKVREK